MNKLLTCKIMYNKIDKKIQKEHEKRVEDNSKVAKKLLKVLMDGDILIGENLDNRGQIKKEFAKEYKDKVEKCLEILLEEDIKHADFNHITQLMIQPIDTMKNILVESINKSINKAHEILWGKEDLEVRMSDVDKVLKSVK